MKYTYLIQKLVDSELGKITDSITEDMLLVKLILSQNPKFHAFSSEDLSSLTEAVAIHKLPFMQLCAQDGLYTILQKIRSVKEQMARAKLHHGLVFTILYRLPTFIFIGIAELNLKYKKFSELIKQLSELETKFSDHIIRIEDACLIAYGQDKRRMIASNPLLVSILGNILKPEDVEKFYLACSKDMSRQEEILTAIILKNLQQTSSQISSRLEIRGNSFDAELNEIHTKFASVFALKLLPLLNNSTGTKCTPIYIALPQNISAYKRACISYYSKRLISDRSRNTFNNLQLISGWISSETEPTKGTAIESMVLKFLQRLDSQVPKFTHALKNTLQTITNDNIIGSFWKSLPPVIKDMINLMYSPWVEYYTALANRQALLKLRNQYTYLEKIKFFTKFTLPIIATFISFIYLAPMYNDLLVLALTPLLISLIMVLIKEVLKGLSKIWAFILRRKEYDTNPRLEAIFSKPNAALVAKFYETLINNTEKELQALNKKSIPVKTTNDKQEFHNLKQTLEALKNEWRIISTDELEHRNTTDQDARDMFICRIITTANNATQKSTSEVEAIVEQVIQSVLHNEHPAPSVTSDKVVATQPSEKRPLTRLFELCTSSIQKSHHYCQIAHAIATKAEIPSDVAEGLKLVN